MLRDLKDNRAQCSTTQYSKWFTKLAVLMVLLSLWAVSIMACDARVVIEEGNIVSQPSSVFGKSVV